MKISRSQPPSGTPCSGISSSSSDLPALAHLYALFLPMKETWVQSLGREEPLEEKMTAHSSILAWEISRTEELGRLQARRSQRVSHDSATKRQQCFVSEK